MTRTHLDSQFLELWDEVAGSFQLGLNSIHGPEHWRDVMRNALYLAQFEPCDQEVLPYFALFHDSCRLNEFGDPGHGKRGAELAKTYFEAGRIPLTLASFERLYQACSLHTSARSSNNSTMSICLDADRLDLGRVGITPDPNLLFTPTAKAIAQDESWHLLNS